MPKKKTAAPLGRPPKFPEPCTQVTVTLPDRILQALQEMDADRAKAIVRCVETVLATGPESPTGVEFVKVSDEHELLVFGPCRALAAIPWLRLVEITPSRFLLAVPSGTAVAELEVALLDLADTLGPEQEREKAMLLEIRDQLAHHRRMSQVNPMEILLVDCL